MSNRPTLPAPASKEPIAIVGIGCRFPGGVHDPASFWELLRNGTDAITDVPADRWKLENYYDPDTQKAGKIKSRKGGFLKDIDQFDAEFFGIFPKEAERIDPQQRLLLEITYEALEDAGIRLENFTGSGTCVFMGVFTTDYWDIQSSVLQRDQISPHVAMGASSTSVANRLSYVYNLKGPSVSLNTACSSSLVAVHLACQSIWNGESELGLAGGVNLILKPETSILMSKGNFLSPDGYCKTFDSRANGYVRSEGGGVILLKPLSKALADGDQIYSLIRATGVNQDGYTEDGFTVPNPDAQMALLRTVYGQAGIDPKQVTYVEAHGTGTPVGDPLETKAFGNVVGLGRTTDAKCVIGSVKTNIGHLEAAAGIAGLIKLALITKHRQIPANLHFEKPNPAIPFEEYKLRVATSLEAIPARVPVVYAGVNSFGAGGTNAHCVLQEYQPQSDGQTRDRADNATVGQLFMISARTEKALKAMALRYQGFLTTTDTRLEDICYSLATRRSGLEHQLSITARTREEVSEQLEAFLKGETRPRMVYQVKKSLQKPKIGFVYSGQGPQWFAMGQQLLQTSPVFRDIILEIDRLFSQLADWSLLEEMNRDESTSRVSDTRIAQPAIMAIQIGLTQLWKSWGVEPAGYVGHSIGEVAAAYAAGALTLAQAVEVIYHRSRNQNQATGKGKMLAVGLDLAAVRAELLGLEDKIDIAAINGPQMITLAGDIPELESLAASLEKRDIFNRFLQVNVPFHSYHMEPLKDEMIAALQHLRPAAATAPLYSTVTGNREAGTHLTSEYWYRNVRETVYFTDAIASMLHDGFDAFIEIGPHPVLSSGVMDMFKLHQRTGIIVPSLRRKEDEELTMLHSLGLLALQGYTVNWEKLSPRAEYVKLPHYPWQHERYWYETSTHRQARLGSSLHPFLKEEIVSPVNEKHRIWTISINPETFNYLQDHQVDGAIVFPGTGHLEIALAAGRASFPQEAIFLEDIHFEKALFLPESGEQPQIRLEIRPEEGEYWLCSRPADGEHTAWTRHSWGRIGFANAPAEIKAVAVKALLEKLTNKLSIPDFYVELKEAGLAYGETFRRVQKVWVQEGEILAAVSLSPQTSYGVDRYAVHPALLDACLHTIFAAREHTEENPRGIYLPVAIARYQVFDQPDERVWTYVSVTEASDEYLKGNYQILNEEGKLVAIIEGLVCQYIPGSRGEGENHPYRGLYEYTWEVLEQTPEVPRDVLAAGECYLLFADQQGVSNVLVPQFMQQQMPVIQVHKGERFQKIHENVFQINPTSREDINAVLEAIETRGQRIRRIVYLWAVDYQLVTTTDFGRFDAAQTELTESTMHLLQVMDGRNLAAGVVFVTQGAEVVLPQERVVNYPQAAILGMARVFLNEYPYIPVRIMDLDLNISAGEGQLLFRELTVRKEVFTEIALREERMYVRRLAPVTEALASEKAAKTLAGLAQPFGVSGDVNNLAFHQLPLQQLAADEVLIEVLAAGLTTRDVEVSDPTQVWGRECAGVIRQVGSAAQQFKPGDPVIAWAPGALAGYVRAKVNEVIARPAALSPVQAAGMVTAYLTAAYALWETARLAREETVLIHTAQWEISLAAIEIANGIGARIIATAATPARKEYLYRLGVTQVLDEQTGDFAATVMSLTNGRGADVVLNSLSGIGMVKSLKCLAPFGRFIEIGEENAENTAVDPRRLGNNRSFHVLELKQLLEHKPALAYELMTKLTAMCEAGKLKSIPVQAFSIAMLPQVLPQLSAPERMTKMVLEMDGQPLKVLAPQTLVLSAQATYLITGGASGFGLEIARWFVTKGAKHLVLVSRSGPKSDADRQAIAAMEAAGVRVKLAQLDITDYNAVQALVQSVQQHMPALKGIVHSAAVLDDQSVPNLTDELFMKVYRPKVYGAWNFHEATQSLPLDFFLMFSSISAVFGFPGQANYSSANNFLDKLALHRQSLGLPACAANLGVLGDFAGMSKEDGRLIRALINQGWKLLSLPEVTEKLENVLLQQPATRVIAQLDWKRFRDFYYNLKDDSRFAHLMNESDAKGAGAHGSASLPEMVRALPEAERLPLLTQKVAEALASVLGIACEKIDTAQPITRIGLDSLMLNQLRNWIQQKLEINFPLMKIAKGPSIIELAAMLLTELGTPNHRGAATGSADASGIASEEDITIYNQWLVRNKRIDQEQVRYRIFCIHPVGAGASMFSHFIYNPPKDAEVLAFQLPGRENRLDEPHFQQVDQLVVEMARAMAPLLDKPFIVFGHSFGGMVGFELIRLLQKQYGKQPVQLFISGTIAPQLTKKWKERDVISETAILTNSEERLLSLMSYIDDVAFLKKILPVMRKDMAMIMNYVYVPNGKFTFPITAFAAEQDTVVYPHEVEQWKEQTGSTFTLEVLNGDHWFLSRNKDLISQRLAEALEEAIV